MASNANIMTLYFYTYITFLRLHYVFYTYITLKMLYGHDSVMMSVYDITENTL